MACHEPEAIVSGSTFTAYHGTTSSSARAISASGVLRPASSGMLGPGVYLCRDPRDAGRWAAQEQVGAIYADPGRDRCAARALVAAIVDFPVAIVEVDIPANLRIGTLRLDRFPVSRGGVTLAEGDTTLLERYSSEVETILRGKNEVEPEVVARFIADGGYDIVELLVPHPDPSEFWRTSQLVVTPDVASLLRVRGIVDQHTEPTW